MAYVGKSLSIIIKIIIIIFETMDLLMRSQKGESGRSIILQ